MSPVQPPVPSSGLRGHRKQSRPPFCTAALLPRMGTCLSAEALSHGPAGSYPAQWPDLSLLSPPTLAPYQFLGVGPGGPRGNNSGAAATRWRLCAESPTFCPLSRAHTCLLCADTEPRVCRLGSAEQHGGNGWPRLALPWTPGSRTRQALEAGCSVAVPTRVNGRAF